MGHRIIPAALASVGFLVTFTVRSWHQDLWSPRQVSDSGIARATEQHTASSGTSTAARPASPQPFASVMQQEATRLRALPTPATPVAVTPTATAYLAERDRESGHDGRLR
jgi:hypothetical protein